MLFSLFWFSCLHCRRFLPLDLQSYWHGPCLFDTVFINSFSVAHWMNLVSAYSTALASGKLFSLFLWYMLICLLNFIYHTGLSFVLRLHHRCEGTVFCDTHYSRFTVTMHLCVHSCLCMCPRGLVVLLFYALGACTGARTTDLAVDSDVVGTCDLQNAHAWNAPRWSLWLPRTTKLHTKTLLLGSEKTTAMKTIGKTFFFLIVSPEMLSLRDQFTAAHISCCSQHHFWCTDREVFRANYTYIHFTPKTVEVSSLPSPLFFFFFWPHSQRRLLHQFLP